MRKRRNGITAVLLLCGSLLFASCSGDGSSIGYDFKDPSAEPIKAVVRTTVPLAYAASAAMSSVTGSVPPNAIVSYSTCTATPSDCVAVVTITDDDSLVPLQLASGTGTMTVYGYWSSPNQAIFTVAFSAGAGSSLFPIHSVSIFPVIRSGSSLKIVYANIDVDVAVRDPGTLSPAERSTAFLKLNRTASNDASANVSMDAWIIDRNSMNTPDVSDDIYSISGGGQYVGIGSGSTSLVQLGAAGITIGPDCLLNPNAGFAALNELATSTSSVVSATALITFPSSCDGTARVAAATGNYLLANGKSIPLNLSNP